MSRDASRTTARSDVHGIMAKITTKIKIKLHIHT